MDAHRDVQLLGGVVDGVEVGVAQQPFPLGAAHVDAHGAVLPGDTGFLVHMVGAQQWHHGHPVQAVVGLPPALPHPAVVAAAQRQLDLGPGGERDDEDGGEDHLDVHPELIHVPEPHRHVPQLAGLQRRVLADVAGLEPQGAVHQPVLVDFAGTVQGADDVGAELAVGAVHKFPGLFGFENVCVGIDSEHFGLLFRINGWRSFVSGVACIPTRVANQRPFHRGVRFSTKARGPSLLSSVVRTRVARSLSSPSAWSSGRPAPL